MTLPFLSARQSVIHIARSEVVSKLSIVMDVADIRSRGMFGESRHVDRDLRVQGKIGVRRHVCRGWDVEAGRQMAIFDNAIVSNSRKLAVESRGAEHSSHTTL